MRIGGPMEVTREFFSPIVIKIERISEIDALIKALEDALDNSPKESKEHFTLIGMLNSFKQ